MKQATKQNTPSTHHEIDDFENLSPGQKAYWNSLSKQVIEGEKYFWNQNELATKEGYSDPDCPPNTIRTNVPRKLTFDPSQKFTNKRRPGNRPSVGKRSRKSNSPGSGSDFGDQA
jgi:hypothetical protein